MSNFNDENSVFWASSNNVLGQGGTRVNNGVVISLAGYAACRALGGSVSTCVAACTVAILL